jgi:hypothetical protein
MLMVSAVRSPISRLHFDFRYCMIEPSMTFPATFRVITAMSVVPRRHVDDHVAGGPGADCNDHRLLDEVNLGGLGSRGGSASPCRRLQCGRFCGSRQASTVRERAGEWSTVTSSSSGYDRLSVAGPQSVQRFSTFRVAELVVFARRDFGYYRVFLAQSGKTVNLMDAVH